MCIFLSSNLVWFILISGLLRCGLLTSDDMLDWKHGSWYWIKLWSKQGIRRTQNLLLKISGRWNFIPFLRLKSIREMLLIKQFIAFWYYVQVTFSVSQNSYRQQLLTLVLSFWSRFLTLENVVCGLYAVLVGCQVCILITILNFVRQTFISQPRFWNKIHSWWLPILVVKFKPFFCST